MTGLALGAVLGAEPSVALFHLTSLTGSLSVLLPSLSSDMTSLLPLQYFCSCLGPLPWEHPLSVSKNKLLQTHPSVLSLVAFSFGTGHLKLWLPQLPPTLPSTDICDHVSQ